MKQLKEAFVELVKAVKEKSGEYIKDDMNAIDLAMTSFCSYVDAVYRMEVVMPIIMARYEGEERRYEIERLDRARRSSHDAAISSARMLNRMCEAFGTEAFCPDTEDRYVIADFCGVITITFFCEGIHSDGKTIDDIIFQLKKGDVRIVKKKITEEVE